MTVVIEFLGHEQIENVVTSLNFKTDKIYYFGYQDEIDILSESTKEFLYKYCKIEKDNIHFIAINRDDFIHAIKTIEVVIMTEKEHGNNVYFDITGGDSLILVAFGYVSKELDTPLHYYDVPTGKLIEMDEGSSYNISTDATPHKINLTIEKYIRLKGGIINHTLDDIYMDCKDSAVCADMNRLWNICARNKTNKRWTKFCKFICFPGDMGIRFHMTRNDADLRLREFGSALNFNIVSRMVDEAANVGLLKNVVHDNIELSFEYKNNHVKKAIMLSGTALEFRVLKNERETINNYDCCRSVNLDWDGEILPRRQDGKTDEREVYNEIDVISINGYVPVFISCKFRNIKKEDLYELKAVTERFGGKYAKMVVASAYNPSITISERAKEMGIEIRVY